MDITALFKACVKTVRTRNKSLSVSSTDNLKNDIFKRRVKTSVATKARPIIVKITELHDLLVENKKAYLNFGNYINTSSTHMTDVERDKFDTGVKKILTTVSDMIKDFKEDSKKIKGSSQFVQHRDAVIVLVENYLKFVCKMYSEMKAKRVKRAVEIREMQKIETKREDTDPYLSRVPRYEQLVVNASDYLDKDGEAVSIKNSQLSISQNMEPPSMTKEDELSPDEMQMFESENKHLYNELNNLDEEVKQMESKIVHISELQQVFTEKILEQKSDIERISTTVVSATENVRDANEQIRAAIQRNAGLRVWVLFFLLVMSLSLLFLDWYND